MKFPPCPVCGGALVLLGEIREHGLGSMTVLAGVPCGACPAVTVLVPHGTDPDMMRVHVYAADRTNPAPIFRAAP